MDRVEVPINLGGVIELFVSEQVKVVVPDLVCFSNHVSCFARQLPAQKLATALDLIFAEEEFRWFRMGRHHRFKTCVQAASVPCQINSLSRCLR